MWRTLPPLPDVQADPHAVQRLADVARFGDHRTLQAYVEAFAEACGSARQCCKEAAALLPPFVFDPAWRATQEMGAQVHFDIKVKVVAEWDKVAQRLEAQRLALLEEAAAEHDRQGWWEETQRLLFSPGALRPGDDPDELDPAAGGDVAVPDELPAEEGDCLAEGEVSVGDEWDIALWDDETRCRLKDITTLYEDNLLLVVPALHADWEERIRQVPYTSWWCDFSHALHPSFLPATKDDLVFDPADVDVMFEFQRLHYNRYCDNLRALSRQLVWQLVQIDERKAKHRMVRAELTLRIRELTRAALEVLECQRAWRRRVWQRFAEVERWQVAAKRRLLVAYVRRAAAAAAPPSAPPATVGRLSTAAVDAPGVPAVVDPVGMATAPNEAPAPEPPIAADPLVSHADPSVVLTSPSQLTINEVDGSPGFAGGGNFLDLVTGGGGLSTGVAALDLLRRVACEDRLDDLPDVLTVADQSFAVDFLGLPPGLAFPVRAQAVLFPAVADPAPGSLLLLGDLPITEEEWVAIGRHTPAAAVVCCGTAPPPPPCPAPSRAFPVGWVGSAAPVAAVAAAGVAGAAAVLGWPGPRHRERLAAVLWEAGQQRDLPRLCAAAGMDVDVAPLLRRLCLQNDSPAVGAMLKGVAGAGRPLPVVDGLEMATMASEEVMRLLLKHSLLDAATWYTVAPRRLTWTALHAAAQNNSAGVVAALAHAPGADVRAVAWHEGAPKGVLYFACDRPTPEPDLVECLLRCGAEVDVPAVDEAARRGAWAAALLLLRHASPLIAAQSTALWYACTSAPVATVERLLAAGCPADTKLPAPNRTPLHAACLRPLAEAVPLAQLLLQASAFVDVGYRCAWFRGTTRYTSNCTPLFCACQAGNTVLVKMLLQRGARPDTSAAAEFVWEKYAAEDAGRWCPALWRCERHHVQPKGCTALEVARRGGHCDIVELLLGHWPLQRHLAASAAR